MDAVLRLILFQVMTANSLAEVEIAIKAMCTEDVIAEVKERVDEFKAEENKCS